MTYTALALFMLLTCVALGVWGGSRAQRPRVAAVAAAAMVMAQFALLMFR
jgi:hypothetical protein